MPDTHKNGYSVLLKIITVGNDLYGDDGVGVAIMNTAKSLPDFDRIQFIDCATDALGLIDHMKETKHVLIIDAAKMGESPGTVKVFDAEDANLTIKTDHLSIHGISLAETMNIAKRIGFYPDTVTIMGIEPERLTINTGLSNSVANAIPTAITKLIEFQSAINPN